MNTMDVNAYLIDTERNEVSPCNLDSFYLLKQYNYYGLDYVVFKVTKNESRDITFFFSKLI